MTMFTIFNPAKGYANAMGEYVGYNFTDSALYTEDVAKAHGIDITSDTVVLTHFTEANIKTMAVKLPVAQ